MTLSQIAKSLLLPTLLLASARAATSTTIPTSDPLTQIATTAVRSAQSAHPDWKLKDDDIAVTLISLSPQSSALSPSPSMGSFRGDAPIYPASVIKLFYLAYAHQLLADGKLADTPELRRGLKEMIVNSDNDATAYILYAVTDAPNGAELPEKEMAEWSYKRNAVNRYFQSLGYPKINACQCAYSFGPFGRERIFLGEKFNNRNSLSTNATARLLADIVLHRIVSPKSCDDMLALLKRDMTTKSEGGDDQAHGFSALALDADKDKLYSKAGWTSTARHDAAYIETPDGLKFVLVTFTTGHARERNIIPAIVKSVMDQLRAAKP